MKIEKKTITFIGHVMKWRSFIDIHKSVYKNGILK